MESVRKHWDIRVVTTEKRRNHLVSEQNSHTKIQQSFFKKSN